MRRDASPADDSRECERIEPARIVVRYALWKDGAFPFDGRRFKAFEPSNRFEQPLLAAQLPLRAEMLPVEYKAHVNRGRYRLDLFAQRMQCALMNTLQQAPLAPLHIFVGDNFCAGSELKAAAQDC